MSGRERDASSRFIRSREPTPIETPTDSQIDIARRVPLPDPRIPPAEGEDEYESAYESVPESERAPESEHDPENDRRKASENTCEIAGENSGGGGNRGLLVRTKTKEVKLVSIEIEKLTRINIKS